MKKTIVPFTVLVSFLTASFFSQAQSVGIGTSTPNGGFQLHIQDAVSRGGLIIGASNNTALHISSTASAPAVTIIKEPGSSSQAIYVDHQGSSGPVAQFRRTNADAVGAVLIGYTNSNQTTSPAIYGNNEGTGDAAIVGRISNTANTYSAIYGETNGQGSAIYARHIGSVGSGLFVQQEGTGRAGQFQINNVNNSSAALRGYTDGTGMAGFFTISNTSNTSPAVFSATNGTGAAVQAESSNTSNALAFYISNGGMRLNVQPVTADGPITNRSAAYRINAGTNFSLGFTAVEGDVFFLYNNTASPVVFSGLNISANTGISAIYIAGSLRLM